MYRGDKRRRRGSCELYFKSCAISDQKDDYKNEEEVRVFFIRNGNEKDIKESKCIEGGVPRIYLQLKVSTIIKEIILGPKIGNGYDKVPYIYWKLQKISEQQPVSVSQSAIEYV